MADWRETELKLGLPDETAWCWVRDRIGPVQVEKQENHFFDTQSRDLRDLRIGVRLRSSAGRLVRLTVKGDATQDTPTAITRRIELERDSTAEELAQATESGLDLRSSIEIWRAIKPSDPVEAHAIDRFLAALRDVAIAPLHRFGGFTNERTTGQLELGDEKGPLQIEIELDRSRYGAYRTDFEIEVERSSESNGELTRTHRALVHWLDREGGIQSFTAESKLARLEKLLSAGN